MRSLWIWHQDDTIFAFCYHSCDWKVPTSRNTQCCIHLIFHSSLPGYDGKYFASLFSLSLRRLEMIHNAKHFSFSHMRSFFNCWKISSLAENTSSRIVFNEVLAAAERDIATKDVSRLRGGWPIQEAFHVSFIYWHAVSYYLLISCMFMGLVCIKFWCVWKTPY